MSADDIKLPPMPNLSAAEDWEAAIHAWGIAAIQADRASRAAVANSLAPGYLSDDLPTLRKRVSALCGLVSAKEAQCSHLARELAELRASTNPDLLASEREANAILTDELERLHAAPSPQGDAGWMLIEEDAPIDVPMDTSVLLAWWDDWSEEWQIEANYAGSDRGGWRHGRATHWMPLPDPPAARSTPAKGGE